MPSSPIYNPRYGGAFALPWLRDDDLVNGYVSNGNPFAYPIKVLNFRELVNDVIDGVPILVHPMCPDFSGLGTPPMSF